MNELLINENIKIEDMIYEIRGKQVILDSDLAKLYHTQTFRINEVVKNNPKKLPGRYVFRITDEEYFSLISKTSISNGRVGSRKGHNVFTEQGVAMLATILKTEIASEVSINIMDAFVIMRKYISNNLIEQKYMNNQVIKNTENIILIQELFNNLSLKGKKFTYFLKEKYMMLIH